MNGKMHANWFQCIMACLAINMQCCREGSVEERRSQLLCETEVVLAWVLQCLAHCDRVGRKKDTRLSPLPFPDLLCWTYHSSKAVMADLSREKEAEVVSVYSKPNSVYN